MKKTGVIYILTNPSFPQYVKIGFVFLASDETSYITGVVLSVDGMART